MNDNIQGAFKQKELRMNYGYQKKTTLPFDKVDNLIFFVPMDYLLITNCKIPKK